MFIVIATMSGGIIFGYLMRRHRLTHISRLTTGFIWVLLFVLGIEVGSNPNIMKSLHTLGFESLFIAVMSTMGSVIAAMLLWKSVKKDEEKNNER
jgi:uncharacterized membrane protein YbjE (DUF340 family)